MVARLTNDNDRSLSDLLKLARLSGIEVSYEDVKGEQCNVSNDTLLALLPTLGAEVQNLADASAVLLDRIHTDWSRVLEPVTTVWDGGPGHILIRLPSQWANDNFKWRIAFENQEAVFGSVNFSELADQETDSVKGVTYFEKRFRLPDRIPLGYHWFSLEVRGQECKSLIISAPTRAFTPSGDGWERSWGVFLPLHALISRQSLGAGDFGDLGSLCEWAGRLGAGFVGTLPLLTAFLDEPFEISPYSPVSRLFWNEFYLNISRIPELRLAPRARERLESLDTHKAVDALRSGPLVDYRRLMELKRPVLEELAKTFFSSDSNRRTAFESFASQRPRLEDYATFRAVGDRLGTPWPEWESRLRDCAIVPNDYSHDAKRYHMYVQWLAHTQLQVASNQESGAGLYMDLPLGVNGYGYDVWRERDSFAVGVTGGCPPDVVFPGGQNWGFVPLHPDGIRNGHYAYVKDYLRHLLSMAKILRIDHMPSFHRVFWIPPGRPASEGAFVRYHAEELYAVFCLESHRHKTMLVGEDLGTVPPEVPTSMCRHNFHRMYVTQYELKPDPSPALPVPPAASLAMVNTHDMVPFAGFWQDCDLEERRQAGLLAADKLDDERTARSQLRTNLLRCLEAAGLILPGADVSDLLRACLINLRDSPARMVLLNLEDLWQETHSQNIPSTSDGTPNWRRKARLSFEEFGTDPHVLELIREVSQGFNHFGRDRHNGSSYARL